PYELLKPKRRTQRAQPRCDLGSCGNGSLRRFRNLRNGFRYFLRLVLQRQVGLSDDSILILSTTFRPPAFDCAMRTARSCCLSVSTVPVNVTELSSVFTLTLVLASAGSQFGPC